MVIIMVAPVVLTTQFSNVPDNRNGIFLFYWIHPMIVLVKYNIGNRTMELRLFGWTATIADKKRNREIREAADGHDGVETEDPQPAPSPDSGGGTGNGLRKKGKMPGPQQKTGHASRTSQPTAAETGKQDKASKTAVPEDGTAPDRFTWSKLKKTIAILRQGHGGPKIFRWCIRLIRMSMRTIRFDHLLLYAKAGVEDPAETGKFYGYFAALHSALFSNRKNMDVRLEPRFMSDVLEFEGSVGLKSSIAAAVMPIIVAFVTFPYITFYFVWRRLKKVYSISGRNKKA
jgi:hypothetical protein